MWIAVYNKIASWPIWPALILFTAAAYSVLSASPDLGDISLRDDPRRFKLTTATARYNWTAVLVGIIAGLCAIVKFCIDIGTRLGWLPEKLQGLVQKKPPFD